jgi:ferredoxin
MTAGLEAPPSSPATHARVSEATDPLAALELRGWTGASIDCAPKIAALSASAALTAAEPVPGVSYQSQGNLLIVAGTQSARAQRCAEGLASSLHVTLLAESAPAEGPFVRWRGRVHSLTGYLGEFNAILENLVTSEGARGPATPARFDLVLDFSEPPLFEMRQPPQGYYRAPLEQPALDGVMRELREAVGEFEKPRFFAYRENLCAHGRSGVSGCTACIDVCSTRAIASEGERVRVDPHLCMGCGACATVCPSGAMSYQFPRVPERGEQLKRMLHAYRDAGGVDACVVFHDGAEGRALLEEMAQAGAGLPPRALPVETFHIASIGLDLLLPALAYGAAQVAVIAGPAADREYMAALRFQMQLGETLLQALGYAGQRLHLIEAADAAALHQAFAGLPPAAGVASSAQFALSPDKRTAIEFAVEHLAHVAPKKVDEVALPAGAPYGAVAVDRAKCTMCMACVGACPESALMDGVDRPLLKFLERNCVQCGLCESTCPEDAITLEPRWLLTPAVREARIVNQTEPFHCVCCDKPFGTKQMVEAMMGRLGGHSMFTSNGALRRLQMCADCRVVDMMSNKDEMSILNLGAER